jgi:plastocyanin
MRPSRHGRAFPAAVVAALALATPGSAAPRVVTVEIKDMKFAPVPGGLRPGDRVVWVNHDLFRHSATAIDRSFEIDLQPGQQGGVILRKPGPIPFFCKYHPGMKGVIVIGR